MESDPTPGDPEEVRELADELQTFADDVAEALGKVRGLASDRAVQDWAGLSAEAFRNEFDGVPGNLEKLRDSYDLCAQALGTYWPKLQTAQGQADRALDRAIAAQADLSSAQGALGDAQGWVSRAGDEAERLQREGERAGAPAPDEAEVRAATRDRQAADQARESAQARVDTAQDSLDAARELARQAKEMREEAARQAARDIDEASDAGIQNRKWWQKAVHWVTENWDTIVDVCKVIVAVLGVVVMIIGGPLAWVVLAAALVVLADTLVKYARGEAGLLDVAFAALDCIPGMKGLTTLGGLARGLRGGLSAARTGLRGLRQGALGLGRSLRRSGRGADDLVCRTDPIDMATGEMVMSETDVELPGALPLVLRRHHRSRFRSGGWFGPSWASTLDQRLLLDPAGLRLVTDDGMILDYPRPEAGVPVLPVEGPRWPLRWENGPGSGLVIERTRTGEFLRFAPTAGRPGGELPLVAITDRNGNRIRVEYDDEGAPTDVIHEGGYHIGVTTRGGRVTALRLLNGDGRPLLRRFEYGAQGDLTHVVNSSEKATRFSYDERRRITGWLDRNSVWYRYVYDDSGRCVATEGMDGLLNSRIAYDTADHRTTFTDALGHTTVYQFNDCYQLVQQTDALGHRTNRVHDRFDRLRSLTDPLGRTTRYEYDADGHLSALVEPDGTRHIQENDSLGKPVAVTQPDGGVWRMTYDERGNLTSETDPAGGRIDYTFDRTGSVVTITDADGRSARLENDATGMPVSATDAEGAVTRLERDAFGRVVVTTAPDGRVTRSRWTTEGLPAGRVHPDGSAERRRYDGEGNLLEHIGPSGASTRFAYYGLDLLSSRIDPDGTRLDFAYDGELRVTSVTNGAGAEWTYEYDPVGRLTRETDFGGRTHRYRHDAVGQLLERTNSIGQTVHFVRDHRGKVVEQRAPEGVTTFAYDLMGEVREAHAPGVELSYERDALGRILAETCNGATVRSEYDARGRRIRRVTPSGHESRWEYDDRDQPTAVETAGRRVTFAYDGDGREVERRVGEAGLSQTWNDAGLLAAQTLRTGHGPAARSLQQRAYTYRPDGAVTAITDRLAGDRSIDLDGRGRVTGVRAEGWTERYAYDAAGDLAETDLLRDEGRPRRRRSDIGYQHDAQGRVVVRRRKRLSRKADVWHYTWDSQDRLIALTTPEGTRWTYLYDPFGRRVAKRRMAADSVTVEAETLFHWDRFVPAEQTESTAGGGLRRTVWDWEQDRFTPVTQIESSALRDRPQEWIDERFYGIVADLVGTPTELFDETGEVAWHQRATVWGAPLDRADDQRAYCPLRFPGQYADPESGLHYNYQRHYDPDTGQYVTLDPLGLAPGPNPRAYVTNPHTAVDPFGLAPDCERALAAARERANLEQARPGANKHTRPTSSAGLAVTDAAGNQHVFNGASIKGGGDHNLHPDVQAAYDRVPQNIRLPGNQHGRCGEAEALTNALNAGVDPRGGTMAAVQVRAVGNDVHGDPKVICPSCAHVLDQFGITGVT
ncbi:DUF6531 domain-containing protein [Streptomyces sp. NPDC049881]|uniref:DUF6531 domain-containing protein n=1 Tax=Streptomyces sp. NPDC049881 TaxID=3155778 RepID=UPI0034140F38